MKTAIKTLLLLCTLGYLVFALVKVSRPANEMICTGVEYMFQDSSEVRLIDKEGVSAIMTKNKISPKGKRMRDIDIKNIEKLLSENPYIDTVNCYHTASGKLCIRITPMHPIIHCYAEDGDEFYVDDKGNILPGGGICTDLCIVTGQVTRKYASSKLVSLGKILNNDPYWNKQTQQLNITGNGYVELIPRIADQKILLGAPQKIEEKLERVRIFYENAMPKTGWNKYNVINAMYGNQIIAKKE